MKNKNDIVVVELVSREAHLIMEEVGNVRFGDPALKNNDEDALIALIQDADAVCITSRGAFTKRVIEASKNLKIIAKCGAPASNVDMEAAARRGIPVTWTPGSNSVSVAEHALVLMLSLLKQVPQTMAVLQGGGWHTQEQKGLELTGRSVGIVGLGQSGRELARLLAPFGVEMYGFDPFVPEAAMAALGVKKATLEVLLAQCQIVSLHCQLSPETRRMINKDTLRRMRRDSYLVNTARGGLVDEADLRHALTTGEIAAAALDVFEEEPAARANPLLHLPNAIVTPHMAGWTSEALIREAKGAAEEVIRVLRGEEPANVSNPDFRKFRTA